MFTASSSVYAANYSSRALCSRKAAKDCHMFLVGTCSLHEENDINIIDYQEDSNSIISISTYQHPEQIFSLEASSHDPDLFLSSWINKSNECGLTLWRMSNRNNNDNFDQTSESASRKEKLLLISELDTDKSKLSIPKWHHMKDTIISSNCDQLISYSVTDSDVKVNTKISLTFDQKNIYSELASPALAWDPHSAASVCAVAVGSSVQLFDLRKNERTSTLAKAHDGTIRLVGFTLFTS